MSSNLQYILRFFPNYYFTIIQYLHICARGVLLNFWVDGWSVFVLPVQCVWLDKQNRDAEDTRGVVSLSRYREHKLWPHVATASHSRVWHPGGGVAGGHAHLLT